VSFFFWLSWFLESTNELHSTKYGFSITTHLLDVLGEVATGYNIGCKFGTMVRKHPVLSSLAAAKNYKSLVGGFHGHAHCRRCQLKNLTTYVEGVGLEDLEECESFFSKSNTLASRTRYSTPFHRQQAIITYLKHADTVDAYQGLCKSLASYRYALAQHAFHSNCSCQQIPARTQN
jgi:hypothetical protein